MTPTKENLKNFLEKTVTGQDFSDLRKRFGKTQKQMAQLLGVSIKAVHSYEQGWRSVPDHVEKQLLLLAVSGHGRGVRQRECWVVNKCPAQIRRQCPAWEFNRGTLCWLINGTICHGTIHKTWKEKIRVCRSCPVLTSLLDEAPDQNPSSKEKEK
ncbi:MAG: two-CW domain-containing protein [Thermodesulfobacteriota bacterium]